MSKLRFRNDKIMKMIQNNYNDVFQNTLNNVKYDKNHLTSFSKIQLKNDNFTNL